ncbi:MAG TPA: hypothetical protein VN812_00590, partial [Candidatus Acidoferrales bacterium]|nr:hypothetical protein [Candidatus Acidoferrales bacterium]
MKVRSIVVDKFLLLGSILLGALLVQGLVPTRVAQAQTCTLTAADCADVADNEGQNCTTSDLCVIGPCGAGSGTCGANGECNGAAVFCSDSGSCDPSTGLCSNGSTP